MTIFPESRCTLPVHRIRLVCAALPLLAVGCGSPLAPRIPRELGAPSLEIYSQSDFKTDADAYRKAIQSGDLATAQTLRNQIAYRVMADVESGYGKFEQSLTSQRAAFETGSDAVQLGITAATTVVGVGDVKDMLAASLSAFQGTRLSYDKNWFRDKTTEALLSQMRATRKTKQAQLILSLGTRDVKSYPLEGAWIDLVDFYYAGTVPSALVEIAANAGAKAQDGSDKLNDAIHQLTPTTPAQAVSAADIRDVYDKLAANTADPAKSSQAVTTLSQILSKAGYSPAIGASASDLLTLFRQAMNDARTDNAKLASLSSAVKSVNVP